MVGKTTGSKTTKSTKTTKKQSAPKKTATKTTKTTSKATKTSKPVAQTTKRGWSWKKAITMAICVAIPLAVGMASAAITGGAMKKFGQFNQPPLSPPAWLFPVAWTILYILMGVAAYFIFTFKPQTERDKKVRIAALILFCGQLAFNFAWSPIFFLKNEFFIALMWLLAMWLMIIMIMMLMRKRSMVAMWCLLPYVLWCLFAMYLNASIMMLN